LATAKSGVLPDWTFDKPLFIVYPSKRQRTMKRLAIVLILLFMAASVPANQGGSIANTVYISGKAVVFFGPSWNEYVALPEKYKDAIDEELYDFTHYRLQVLSYLEANGIQGISTTSETIRIQIDPNEVIHYIRSDFDHAFGLIMTDGRKEPKVFLGAATASQLKSMFEEYFGLY
jgi:hypothetical protein